MTCKLSRVCIIEHSLLGDTLSNDHGRWKPSGEGSNNFVPKVEDSLHLGKLGIRLLANSIQRVTEVKFLGVVIDDRLSWEPQIKQLKG